MEWEAVAIKWNNLAAAGDCQSQVRRKSSLLAPGCSGLDHFALKVIELLHKG